jgi:hypothetical protein
MSIPLLSLREIFTLHTKVDSPVADSFKRSRRFLARPEGLCNHGVRLSVCLSGR